MQGILQSDPVSDQPRLTSGQRSAVQILLQQSVAVAAAPSYPPGFWPGFWQALH